MFNVAFNSLTGVIDHEPVTRVNDGRVDVQDVLQRLHVAVQIFHSLPQTAKGLKAVKGLKAAKRLKAVNWLTEAKKLFMSSITCCYWKLKEDPNT